MTQQTLTVRARWDEASRSWWTDGEDIPGLCCEAASFDELAEIVFALAPELLTANGVVPAGAGDVPLTVTAERHGTAGGLMASLYRELAALLRAAGCRPERHSKGSHEVWYSPLTSRTFTVPSNIDNRPLANAILKQAGLPKAF